MANIRFGSRVAGYMRALLFFLAGSLTMASCSGTSERLDDGSVSVESQFVVVDKAWAFENDLVDDPESLADILASYPNVYVGRQGNDARVLVRGCKPTFRVNYIPKRLSYLEANVMVDAATVSHIEVRVGRKNPVYAYDPVIHIYTKRRALAPQRTR